MVHVADSVDMFFLHKPEAGCAILIDDHFGHGFAQIAGIAGDVPHLVHVEHGGR